MLAECLPNILDSCSVNSDSLNSLTVAPLTTKKHTRMKSAAWFSNDTGALKQSSRKFERNWRTTKQESFRLAWVESFKNYKRALSAARSAYFSNLININKNNPRFLFDTVARLTQNTPANSSSLNADDFLKFFTNKFDSIRDKVTGPHSSQNDGLEPSDTLIDAGTVTRTNCTLSQKGLK